MRQDDRRIVDGVSSATRRMRAQIDRAVRDSEAMPVLITGATGVGKELVAREIHRVCRDGHPFVAVSIVETSKDLLHSTLFGHERGSFTGATGSQSGLLRDAGQGTLCLDELGEIPLDLQAALLRVLDQRMFRPVGARAEVPLHARILASTNRDLLREVEAGRFRRDLYHRLAVHHVRVPSLHERRDDLPTLVSALAPHLSFDAAAWRWIEQRPFPGNVRELMALLHRLSGAARDRGDPVVGMGTIEEVEGVASCRDPAVAISREAVRVGAVPADLKRSERFLIDAVLAKTNGNVSQAATELQMSRSMLRRRLKTE